MLFRGCSASRQQPLCFIFAGINTQTMKSLFAILAISFISFGAAAQSENLGCIDKDMRMESEGMKASFIKQGLSVFKDAMITMESQQPVPVAIEMVKGRIYQMVFIGANTASKVSLEIMDGNHNRIVEKAIPKGGGHTIAYSFIPEKTDVYLVMLYQKFKGKTACGSFTLMHDAPVGPKQADEPAKTRPAPARK